MKPYVYVFETAEEAEFWQPLMEVRETHPRMYRAVIELICDVGAGLWQDVPDGEQQYLAWLEDRYCQLEAEAA